jgi:hypothetical protein
VILHFDNPDHDPQWCTNNFINMGVMRRAESVREKLLDKMTTLGCRIQSPDTNNVSFTNNIKLALLSGFFMQAAHLDQDGNYRTIKCNQVRILMLFAFMPTCIHP